MHDGTVHQLPGFRFINRRPRIAAVKTAAQSDDKTAQVAVIVEFLIVSPFARERESFLPAGKIPGDQHPAGRDIKNRIPGRCFPQRNGLPHHGRRVPEVFKQTDAGRLVFDFFARHFPSVIIDPGQLIHRLVEKPAGQTAPAFPSAVGKMRIQSGAFRVHLHFPAEFRDRGHVRIV